MSKINLKSIVCLYAFLLIPLLFWWSWQFSSILAWLSVVVCFYFIGSPYRDARRAEWEELRKHTKEGSLGAWIGAKFGGKTFSTLLFLIAYLIPNFFAFWMYLSCSNLPFWIFFASFPLVFVAIKQNSGVMDSNRAIGANSFLVALFPSIALALIETFWELIIETSKMNAQAGADSVLDIFSILLHWWSSIIDGSFSFIFSWLPWTEFWVVLISNFLVYFGVFFALSLMFHFLAFGANDSEEKRGVRAYLRTFTQLLNNGQVLLCFAVFVFLILFAIFTKENIDSTPKENQQKIENIEKGLSKILGKNFENTINISEYIDKDPDDIRCGWIRSYIFFGIGCEYQNRFADKVEELQKKNRGE